MFNLVINETDYLDLGPVPSEENCAQVGAPNYLDIAYEECRTFILQIERTNPPPAGAWFQIQRFSHEFGAYYEVRIYFKTDNEEAEEYAYDLEADTPEHWDAKSRELLEEFYKEHRPMQAIRGEGARIKKIH